jgi:hypothetical protein
VVQVVMPVHATHAPPPKPQAWRSVPLSQVSPLQQPGQLSTLHFDSVEQPAKDASATARTMDFTRTMNPLPA